MLYTTAQLANGIDASDYQLNLSEYAKKVDVPTKTEYNALVTTVANKLDKGTHEHNISDIKQLQSTLDTKLSNNSTYSIYSLINDVTSIHDITNLNVNTLKLSDQYYIKNDPSTNEFEIINHISGGNDVIIMRYNKTNNNWFVNSTNLTTFISTTNATLANHAEAIRWIGNMENSEEEDFSSLSQIISILSAILDVDTTGNTTTYDATFNTINGYKIPDSEQTCMDKPQFVVINGGNWGSTDIGASLEFHKKQTESVESSDYNQRIYLDNDKFKFSAPIIIEDTVNNRSDIFRIVASETVSANSGKRITIGDSVATAVMGYWKTNESTPYIYLKLSGKHAQANVFDESIKLNAATINLVNEISASTKTNVIIDGTLNGYNIQDSSSDYINMPSIVCVKSDGKCEIGKYLDFHDQTSSGTHSSDYTVRLYQDGQSLKTDSNLVTTANLSASSITATNITLNGTSLSSTLTDLSSSINRLTTFHGYVEGFDASGYLILCEEQSLRNYNHPEVEIYKFGRTDDDANPLIIEIENSGKSLEDRIISYTHSTVNTDPSLVVCEYTSGQTNKRYLCLKNNGFTGGAFYIYYNFSGYLPEESVSAVITEYPFLIINPLTEYHREPLNIYLNLTSTYNYTQYVSETGNTLYSGPLYYILIAKCHASTECVVNTKRYECSVHIDIIKTSDNTIQKSQHYHISYIEGRELTDMIMERKIASPNNTGIISCGRYAMTTTSNTTEYYLGFDVGTPYENYAYKNRIYYKGTSPMEPISFLATDLPSQFSSIGSSTHISVTQTNPFAS